MEVFTGHIQCPHCGKIDYIPETLQMYDEETIKLKCEECSRHYKVTLQVTYDYKVKLI